MKTYEQYLFNVENLKMGDIITQKGVVVSLDNMYTYHRYEEFYAINREYFTDFFSIDNLNKFTLEEFYEKYEELTINAFERICEYATEESARGAQVIYIRDEWLKRIPDLNLYIQANKYNL